MKKIKYFLGLLCLLLLMACGSQQPAPPVVIPPTLAQPADTVEPLPPDPPAEEATPPVVIDPTIAPEEPAPTSTQPSVQDGVPVLSEMRFFDDRSDGYESDFIASSEVFIEFDYANVADGAVLRRDWYFNNNLFISREESWDGIAYGRDGTRNDISIYDYQSGLSFGQYRVELYLDDAFKGSGVFAISPENVSAPPAEEARFNYLSFRAVGVGYMDQGEVLERPNELFADWYYTDMQAGDTIKRDWFLNGELFITREEPWDFSKYGETGNVRDVSIYDFENGLSTGVYRLDLYVNGIFQASQEVTVIDAEEIPFVSDSTGSRALASDGVSTLLVRNRDGTETRYPVSGRLRDPRWISDGQLIIYASDIVVDPDSFLPTFGVRSELWLVDVEAETQRQIGTLEDDYSQPFASLNDKYVSILSGSGYGDACGVDSRVLILEFSGKELVDTYSVGDFSIDGTPIDEQFAWSFGRFEELFISGFWLSDSVVRVYIGFSDCSDGGLYDLNMDDFTATKVE